MWERNEEVWNLESGIRGPKNLIHPLQLPDSRYVGPLLPDFRCWFTPSPPPPFWGSSTSSLRIPPPLFLDRGFWKRSFRNLTDKKFKKIVGYMGLFRKLGAFFRYTKMAFNWEMFFRLSLLQVTFYWSVSGHPSNVVKRSWAQRWSPPYGIKIVMDSHTILTMLILVLNMMFLYICYRTIVSMH